MQNGEIGYFPGNYVEIIREGRELSDFHEGCFLDHAPPRPSFHG